MAKCYVCGNSIDPKSRQMRRRVKTGEWIRRRYPNSWVSHTQSSYGMRVVCRWCANRIDLKDWRYSLRRDLAVLGLLGLLVLFLFAMRLLAR